MMKKIFLIGDSIRLGYCLHVRKQLENEALVYYPQENCRFSEYVLRYCHEWMNTETDPATIDVVHWNTGLWDVLHLFGDEALTDLDTYIRNLERIHHRIQRFCPHAQQIFATNTSVAEEKYASPDRFMRYNAEIEKYNEAACELMGRLGVPVNDLYTLSRSLPDEARSDATHFNTPEGIRIMGDAVCAQLRPYLR